MVRPGTFQLYDHGNVVSNIERIRAARLQNAAAGANLESIRRRERSLEQIRQMRRQFDNAGEIVQQLRGDGNHDAADTFIQMQRQQAVAAVDFLRTMGQNITNAADYEEFRSTMLRNGLVEEDDLPVDFSKSVFPRLTRRQERKLKVFDLAVGVDPQTGITKRRQHMIDQATGEIVFKGPIVGDVREQELRERIERNRSKAGRLKSGASKEIADQVREHFEGFGGRLKPELRSKVARIRAQAERYAEGGMSLNQAVQQALSDDGEQVGPPSNVGPPAPGTRGRGSQDPFGLR